MSNESQSEGFGFSANHWEALAAIAGIAIAVSGPIAAALATLGAAAGFYAADYAGWESKYTNY